MTNYIVVGKSQPNGFVVAPDTNKKIEWNVDLEGNITILIEGKPPRITKHTIEVVVISHEEDTRDNPFRLLSAIKTV